MTFESEGATAIAPYWFPPRVFVVGASYELGFNNGVAFLGIAPRRDGLVLTVVSGDPLVGGRVQKAERAPKNRCYNYIGLTTIDEIHDQLKGWITRSYQRTG